MYTAVEASVKVLNEDKCFGDVKEWVWWSARHGWGLEMMVGMMKEMRGGGRIWWNIQGASLVMRRWGRRRG